MVVVDLRGFLAGVGAQDPPGVLEQASFPFDRGGEEQGGGAGVDLDGNDARPATSAAVLCRANRARMSSGPVRTRALAWLMVWVRSLVALRLATISARIASTAPSRPLGAPRARPDCAARAALTASSGSDLP